MTLNFGKTDRTVLKVHPNALNMISLYNELLGLWRGCIDEVDKVPHFIQQKYT